MAKQTAKQIEAARVAAEAEAARLAAETARETAEAARVERMIEEKTREMKKARDKEAARKAWETRLARGDTGHDAARRAQETKKAKARLAAIEALKASGAIA